MPRPLVFGNGSLLVCYDSHYRLRDLYWPHVGLYNHVNGYICRTGVWADGQFSWIDEEEWEKILRYEVDSIIGRSEFVHEGLKLRIAVKEAVHPQEPWYERQFTVQDTSGTNREIRLFFNNDFRLNESDVGDTAFYNPYADAMIHYKRETVLLLGGRTPDSGLFEYTTAHRGFGDFHGSSDDARDGSLSWNPMTYGCTDSTYSLRFQVPANGVTLIRAWIIASNSIDNVATEQNRLLACGADNIFEAAREYGDAFLAKSDAALIGLTDDLQTFIRQSLLILRTQIDNEGGIVAANDSDIMSGGNKVNYSNVWPRDGAFVASVLGEAGYLDLAEKYFEFSEKLTTPDRPYFLQKYWPDGTVGPGWHAWIQDGSPEVGHQQDETALTIFELCSLIDRGAAPERANSNWETFIKPATDHMLDFRDKNGLPKPTWDLWEERRGIHIYTVATVIAAFKAASNIATRFKDSKRSKQYAKAADEMLDAMKSHMWDESRGVFLRRLIVKPDGTYEPDMIVDSSSLQVLLLGVLPPNDPMVVSNLQVCERELWVNTAVGGMARYQDDYYQRVSQDVPGNSWVICTMWLAQSHIAVATTVEELSHAEKLLTWATNQAVQSGVLAEQMNPFTGEQLSVSPLTWSHAEVVKTAVDLAKKKKLLGTPA